MRHLIKENSTGSLIAMARQRIITLLGLVLVTALFLSPAQLVAGQDSDFVLALASVYDWGIEGEPELGSGFDVWANVTNDDIANDDDPGIKNVTVHVSGPNMTVNNLMTFNGTYYTGSVGPFPNDGSFDVSIMAYNQTDHRRVSYSVTIVYESDPLPTLDPNVTMPIVVISSVGLMGVVMVVAMVYDRRRVGEELATQHMSE